MNFEIGVWTDVLDKNVYDKYFLRKRTKKEKDYYLEIMGRLLDFCQKTIDEKFVYEDIVTNSWPIICVDGEGFFFYDVLCGNVRVCKEADNLEDMYEKELIYLLEYLGIFYLTQNSGKNDHVKSDSEDAENLNHFIVSKLTAYYGSNVPVGIIEKMNEIYQKKSSL